MKNKSIFCVIFAIVMICSLCACGGAGSDNNENNESSNTGSNISEGADGDNYVGNEDNKGSGTTSNDGGAGTGNDGAESSGNKDSNGDGDREDNGDNINSSGSGNGNGNTGENGGKGNNGNDSGTVSGNGGNDNSGSDNSTDAGKGGSTGENNNSGEKNPGESGDSTSTGSNGASNLTGSPAEILDKLISDIKDAGVEMPMSLPPTEVTSDISQNTIGLSETDFGRLVVSASYNLAAIGTFAHQIIVIQANDAAAAAEVKSLVSGSNGYDAQKWICVWPEKVIAVDSGEYVLVAASYSNVTDAALKAFEKAAGSIGSVETFWDRPRSEGDNAGITGGQPITGFSA